MIGLIVLAWLVLVLVRATFTFKQISMQHIMENKFLKFVPRTNLPKEVMGFPDFPIPEQPRSYLPAVDILHFLDSYADHFRLKQHIKVLFSKIVFRCLTFPIATFSLSHVSGVKLNNFKRDLPKYSQIPHSKYY